MNTADTRTALTDAAEAVRAALAKVESVTDAISRGSEQRDDLGGEIERERVSINTDDNDALQRLAAKETKLRIIKARVPSDEVLPPLTRQLRELLQTLHGPICAFLHPQMEQLMADKDAALKLHVSDAGARLAALQEDTQIHQLRNVMACYWHVFEATDQPIQTAQKVLAEINGLLAGEKPWLKP